MNNKIFMSLRLFLKTLAIKFLLNRKAIVGSNVMKTVWHQIMNISHSARRVFAHAAFAIAAALIGQPHVEAAVPTSDIAPNDIRGVKWTPKDEAKSGVLEFDTAGLSLNRFLNLLHGQGINSIVMKVVDLDNQIPDSVGTKAQKKTKRNAAIANTLKGIKNHGQQWHVFLWKREWFERSGVGVSGNEFETEMSEIINEAKAGGYDDILEGIMPIKVNIETSGAVLKYAVEAANDINSQTNNWLKNKTFLFPGAGMGAYFYGIQNAWSRVRLDGITKESSFFENIKIETRRFVFVLKNMPSQPADVCALDRFSSTFVEGGVTKKGWDELGGTALAGYTNRAQADAARYTFQNETMGFRDLRTYLANNSADYPWLTDVIYWGDANEGTTANSRSKQFHQTLHRLMVEDNGFKGHFTHYPVLNEEGDSATFDLRKYLFQVKTINGARTIQPRGTGWDNWKGWTVDGYIITPTDSTN